MNILPVMAAVIVAGAAYALHLLTRGGAIAAAITGAAALVAGGHWVALLLFFFVSSNVLSRWRRGEREQLVASIQEKGDKRDAMQVIANGGVFTIAALFATGNPVAWEAIGVGAIAAATSDTWSTEIGTVLGDSPRSLWSGEPVAPGTSGGITIAGCIAAYAAAVAVAGVAGLVHWSTPWQAIVVGGLAGSAFDSLLGATIQERRLCPVCNMATERRLHTCGNASVDRGGISGCNNDIVNLMSTIAGAVVTWILA